MGHGLEKDDKMFSVRERPWHGIGAVLESHPVTAEAAINEAGLNWGVKKGELFLKTADGEFVEAQKDFQAVYRETDNKVLGVVTNQYHPVQNVRAFQFMDDAAGEGLVEYHTAGSLQGGRVIWCLAKIPGFLEILPGDNVDKYLLLYTSHDGLMSVRIGLTPIRVVCHNTLTMARGAIENGSNQIANVRHTVNAEEMLKDAAETIRNAEVAFEDAAGGWRFLATAKITAGQLDDYIKAIYPLPELKPDGTVPRDMLKAVRSRIRELHEAGAGSDIPGVRGTIYGAYNAVVELLDHERGKDADVRLRSQWWGYHKEKKELALDTAFQMAGEIA